MDTDAPPRREVIIRSATELFAERGYQAVGMRAIADAVGIRASSLYNHFPSKIDLLYAVCELATEAFISQQRPVLATGGSPRARLEQVMRAHILYFHRHQLEETVGRRELAVLAAEAPERFEQLQAVRRGYQHAIGEVIADGARAGEFTVPEPGLAALALLGLVNSIAAWFRDDGEMTIEAVADAYVAMGVGGLLAPGPAPPGPARPSAAGGVRASLPERP